jgi:iron-sulfur cluster assembly protein
MDEIKEPSITITDKAISALKKKGKDIRIGVRGSGCNGYSYVIQANATPKDNDITYFFQEDLTVRIDPKSLSFLDGSILDYKRRLLRSEFSFDNPNVRSFCGCGESFELKK